MLANLFYSLSYFLLPTAVFLSSSPPVWLLCVPQYQFEGSRPHIPRLDLELWYQEVMAAGEASQHCPPPLPAKAFSGRRLQVAGPCTAFFFLLFTSCFCSFLCPSAC